MENILRNFVDYHLYLFRINTKETITAIIDLVIFFSSLGVLFANWSMTFENLSQNWFLIIVLIGSFIKFLYDVYNITEKIKGYMDLRYGEIFQERVDFENISISKVEKELGYEIIACRINSNMSEYVLNSKKIDNYLNNSLIIQKAENKERLITKFIKTEKRNLMPFLKWQYRNSKLYGKGFFNEKKLCLSKDIFPNKTNSVYCHKGTYYDTFLTNIISGKQLKSNQDDSIIANAEGYFPIVKKSDGSAELKNITSSLMNNEIGISTLAITSDNNLVIWTQNRSAQSSSGLLVPTGSGSCDWDDQATDSFNETIINAMNRELWEESGKNSLCNTYKDVGQTIILGFFRWIIKGGKPEFVGLTKMSSDFISLYANKSEVYCKKEYSITKIEDVEQIIEEIINTENVSVPLYMNLFCLKRYYEENREDLEKYIFSNQ